MGWSELAAPYFATICTQELDGYFSRYNFEKAETEGRVVYVRDSVAMEFTYHVEDAPCYMLMIGIGAKETEGLRLLPIWPLVPYVDTVRDWTFSTEDELRDVIRRVRNDALERTARPLWDDESWLRQLLHEHEGQLRVDHERRIDDDLLARARSAFDAKRFNEATEAYSLLGREALSDLDQKRLAYAQKHA